MTPKQQYIYNCYLEVSRTAVDKPYKLRKNFDDFEGKIEHLACVKLESFFNQHPNINIKDFFRASFTLNGEQFIPIESFTRLSAVKTYTIYQNKYLLQDPDSKEALTKLRESFEFIFNYCRLNNIDFDQYITQKTGEWHTFLNHFKERNIYLYSLFTFPNFETTIQQYDTDLKTFIFGDCFLHLDVYRTKFHTSNTAKTRAKDFYNTLNSLLISKNTNV